MISSKQTHKIKRNNVMYTMCILCVLYCILIEQYNHSKLDRIKTIQTLDYRKNALQHGNNIKKLGTIK